MLPIVVRFLINSIFQYFRWLSEILAHWRSVFFHSSSSSSHPLFFSLSLLFLSYFFSSLSLFLFTIYVTSNCVWISFFSRTIRSLLRYIVTLHSFGVSVHFTTYSRLESKRPKILLVKFLVLVLIWCFCCNFLLVSIWYFPFATPYAILFKQYSLSFEGWITWYVWGH